MKFTILKKEIKGFLKHPIIFSKDEVGLLSEGVDKISKDVHTLIDGEDVEQDSEKFKIILGCLLSVGSKILDSPLHERLISFATSYSELVYNWNSNIQKDEVMRQLCLFISRTCELKGDLINTINTLKEVDDVIRDMSQWSPPSYEISKEYFEKLLEKNEIRGKE